MKKALKIIGLLLIIWGAIEGFLFFKNFEYIKCVGGIENIENREEAIEKCETIL